MASTQDNVLIIGGTSLVGVRLREVIEERQHRGLWPEDSQVRFTSRKPIFDQSLSLDTRRPDMFKPGLNFKTVIVCAPVWLVSEHLLTCLIALGMRRLIAFSSTSRFTKTNSADASERDVVEKLLAGENAIIDFCTPRKVDFTILRPTLIYDEGRDENVTQIARAIKRLGFFPLCAPATGRRQPVHARELAIAALDVKSAPASYNRCYNLSGGETISYREMVERIFDSLKLDPRIIFLPKFAWRFAFACLGIIDRNKALKRNLNMVLRMNVDLCFDHSDATRDFGYRPGPFTPYLSDQTASSLPEGSLK